MSDTKKLELQVQTKITWTDDRVDILKRLWSEGLSASQIAEEIGGGITRNAVIGKVCRLGLPGRAKVSSSRVSHPRKPRTSSQVFRPERPMLHGNTACAVSPVYDYNIEPSPIEVVIPLKQRCTLFELGDAGYDDKCHWPVGDPCRPDFFFCGNKTHAGLPYCDSHARIAYQPPAARRNRPPQARAR